MDFLEKDLEDIIYDSLINDYDCLIERGFHNSFEYSYEEQNLRGFRQLKIGNYGIADIVTVSKLYDMQNGKLLPYLNIDIYELKKDEI